MTEIKICGITDPASMDAVAGVGGTHAADWVGFVFFPPSPRALSPEDAAALAARHPAGPRPVGLFVEPTDAELETVLRHIDLAALQIHAPLERAAEIQARFARPVWQSIGVATAADMPKSAPGVTRLLLDYKPPPGAPLPGGNARSFDWSLLRDWKAPLPWVLAGGLTPETVAAAIHATAAPTVDVSSGVEHTRGQKDPALIRAFITAARAA